MVSEITKLRKYKPMECGYWLLFDSQMLLIEEKRFPEVTGGGRYFYQKFRKGEGVNVILWKWKI